MGCLVFLSAGKKSLEDGRRSDSHRLAYEEVCVTVASGMLFSFGISPSQFFPSLTFLEGFFPIGCAGRMPKINNFFSWLTSVKLLDPLHASCTCLVQIVCTLCALSLVAVLTQLLHANVRLTARVVTIQNQALPHMQYTYVIQQPKQIGMGHNDSGQA